MEFEELWNLLYKELEIIERDPNKKCYRTKYDSVIEKIEEYKTTKFVAENYEFIWFEICPDECYTFLIKRFNEVI